MVMWFIMLWAKAILGAWHLELGTYFPNSPEYKDIDSSIIVSRIVKMMVENGYKVGNMIFQ